MTIHAATLNQYEAVAADGTALQAFYIERADVQVAFALVFAGNKLPHIVHWGRPLADSSTIVNLYDALRPQRVSGALDETPWPSVLPTQAESWIGAPRLELRRNGIEAFCSFEVKDIRIDPDNARISVDALDVEQGVALQWECELDPSGLVRQHATIQNREAGELQVGKVELGFPVPANAVEIMTTTGHHLRERSPQRQMLNVGRFEKPTMVGRPDFDASLLLSAGAPGFGFEHGDVYSVHVGWSGNSVLSAERLPYTQGLIGGGEVLRRWEIVLNSADDAYTTPWVYGSYGEGLNEVAARFHSYLRRVHEEERARLGIAAKPRPVILNTWEAVYFDHDYATLVALADKAVESGVERFVVDDGWFGSRRDDSSGLGDWWVAQDAWPDGERSLKSLAEYVHGRGMEFGLWFEPEMINPDSDTYRAHPDWVLKPTASRLPMQGRMQQVLDLTNPEAFAYIYGAMDALVSDLGIDYIKWDHNKLVTEAVSPYSGRPAVHNQTLAVYKIFRDLKAAHPGLEIESCSSGGGRVDLGILAVADRIWASDCVDPVERADIQRYTSLLVPPEMIGEHVGASPAHSTHRATSQEMRMAMTFFGHMGIEWNLLKEPQANIDKLHTWVDAYKQYRSDFAAGTAVHADCADPSVRVDGVVSEDGSRAVYRFTQLTTSVSYPAAPVRLPGLQAQATYKIVPLSVNIDLEASGIANGQTPLGWWNESGTVLSGATLQSYGVRLPSLHPAQAVLFSVERV
ncbi:alpha-galactosidase [Bifidobacterium tsurumiense]|uniref:alpha-galactosidase n=1 Tax=Bifidobacterium tsurumiense TaxID=356829 RepID=A0A087E9L1_9BIFI|nr:alpha-galactosidase [Bifidobacterium tsurumiense]KFJ04462.1 alpha-galactosidase [Bifidobacterium tsurumiense]